MRIIVVTAFHLIFIAHIIFDLISPKTDILCSEAPLFALERRQLADPRCREIIREYCADLFSSTGTNFAIDAFQGTVLMLVHIADVPVFRFPKTIAAHGLSPVSIRVKSSLLNTFSSNSERTEVNLQTSMCSYVFTKPMIQQLQTRLMTPSFAFRPDQAPGS